MIRLNVSLDPDLNRDLKLLAIEQGTKLTQLVPRLLREALKAERAKQKQRPS